MLNRFLKTTLSFLLTPAATSAIYLLYLHVFTGADSWAIRAATAFVAISSYVAMFVFGAPMYVLLRKFKQATWPSYLVWGLGLGVTAELLSVVLFGPDLGEWISGERYVLSVDPWSVILDHVQIWTLGVVGGAFFWLIARPDRAMKSS